MSDRGRPPTSRARSGVLSILMFIVGAVMLLPGIGAGLCVVALGTTQLHNGIIYACLATGVVGLILIFWALERFGR
jgi:hypothetical protein